MQLVIPALFQTNRLLDMMGEPHLPSLDRLLARGRIEAIPPTSPHITSLDDWLCNALGIARQQDFPIAAICLAVEGNNPGQDNWLRADPVHVRIGRDQLILSDIPSLTDDEAAQLCAALAMHFGEDLSPTITRTGAWIVQANSHTDISTTALSNAIGKHIEPLLPKGADAMHWRKLLNEIQMLLFAHPVNQAREAKGLPTANSVWLWGGGHLPSVPDSSAKPSIMTGHPLAQTITHFAGAELHAMQNAWSADLRANLLILDQPHTALQRGDYAAWLDTIKALEKNWLQPLYNSNNNFELIDPTSGKTLVWKKTDRWKLWRRPEKIRRQTFGFDAPGTNSHTVTNVDEFGNRF